MLQNGRKSLAKLAVVAIPGQRHPPPADLTQDQATLWRAIVATKPADWFSQDTHPLLVAYCRHISLANTLIAAITASTGDVTRLDKLLGMHDRETKAMVRLASTMRLTQQSQYKAETAATRATGSGDADKPWAAAAQA